MGETLAKAWFRWTGSPEQAPSVSKTRKIRANPTIPNLARIKHRSRESAKNQSLTGWNPAISLAQIPGGTEIITPVRIVLTKSFPTPFHCNTLYLLTHPSAEWRKESISLIPKEANQECQGFRKNPKIDVPSISKQTIPLTFSWPSAFRKTNKAIVRFPFSSPRPFFQNG
jgi:hypothetical protein